MSNRSLRVIGGACFRLRALVVDDSRVMRGMLRRALEAHGFEVLEASDGRSALEQLSGIAAPDLALLDWNMPEMNGVELVRKLRRQAAYDAMLVMMVTTETEPQQVELALAAGANEYMMKPFTRECLDDKLALLGLSGK